MKRFVLGITLAAVFLISCTNSRGSFSLAKKAKESIAHASVAYNSLAMFYTAIGNFDAALRILTQGIARLPNEASFFYNQALIHGSHENWDAAQVSQQHAMTNSLHRKTVCSWG